MVTFVHVDRKYTQVGQAAQEVKNGINDFLVVWMDFDVKRVLDRHGFPGTFAAGDLSLFVELKVELPLPYIERHLARLHQLNLSYGVNISFGGILNDAADPSFGFRSFVLTDIEQTSCFLQKHFVIVVHLFTAPDV